MTRQTIVTVLIVFYCGLEVKCTGANGRLPLILWWYDTIFPHIEDGRKLYEVECDKGVVCHSSHDRSMVDYDTFQIIIFYGSDFSPDDVPLPMKTNQMWALLHEESPQNNPILFQPILSKLFNISATFKQESDYPLTSQHVPNIGYLYDRKPLAVDDKNEYRRKKLAPVVYLQSHCDVPSDRDKYVQELMNYIQVDSYGDCLHNKDFDDDKLKGMESMNDEELLDLLAKYKFHIAFENAICDDYITEKIYRALHVGSVPVYMGARNVKEWIPESSAIEASNFTSPKMLAEFLMALDYDDDYYLRFLEYKKNKQSVPEKLYDAIEARDWSSYDPLIPHFVNGFECYVCKKMHEIMEGSSQPVQTNPRNDCPPPKPSFGAMSTMKKDDGFKRWVDDYRQAVIQAKALSKLVMDHKHQPGLFSEYVAKEMLKEWHNEL